MLLKAEGLYKSFNETIVLNDINFKVDPKEVVSLVGKSGAGKTTVLRCIMGLEKCEKGTIIIDDKYICQYENGKMKYADKNQLFEIRKSLGLVFQSYHLFPHMTVLENVTLALTDAYKLPKKEAVSVSTNMLESLGMGDKLGNKSFELSGGQKQRVAIARSCVTNPKLLCFDEPTAALDMALVKDIVKIIRDFAQKEMGVLIISHDVNFVKEVSDRILVIENGVITDDLYVDEYRRLY